MPAFDVQFIEGLHFSNIRDDLDHGLNMDVMANIMLPGFWSRIPGEAA